MGVAIIAVVAVLFQRLDSRIDLLESQRLDRLETGMVDIRERLVRGETKVDSLERWAFQGMPEPQITPPESQATKSS